MGSIHYGLALFNLTRERLPTSARPGRAAAPAGGHARPLRAPPVGPPAAGADRDHLPGPRGGAALPDRRRPRRRASTGSRRRPRTPGPCWATGSCRPLTKAIPGIADRGLQITLDILDATPGSVRLRVALVAGRGLRRRLGRPRRRPGRPPRGGRGGGGRFWDG